MEPKQFVMKLHGSSYERYVGKKQLGLEAASHTTTFDPISHTASLKATWHHSLH